MSLDVTDRASAMATRRPWRIVAGPGAVASIPQLLDELDVADGPVLLLAGHTAHRRAWLPRLRERIPGHVFATLAGPYPTEQTVGQIAELMRDQTIAATVAAGGGSVLDTAKVAAAMVAAHTGGRRRPVIAVPTTPGTGAEATPFATLWDFTAGRKHSFHRPDLTPDAAVVDPDLTATLTPAQLGSAMLDTLAQGAEAAWSTNSTPEAIANGLTAVTLGAGNLERLVADPGDAAARLAISLAGLHSGLAIAVSRTTICHALSYPLTLRHGVPHGHACGLTLGAILSYNAATTRADCADPRGPGHVRDVMARVVAAFGAADPAGATARIEEFIAAAGLAAYRDGGYDHAALAAEALSYDRADNNPRRLDHNHLGALLQALSEHSAGGGHHAAR